MQDSIIDVRMVEFLFVSTALLICSTRKKSIEKEKTALNPELFPSKVFNHRLSANQRIRPTEAMIRYLRTDPLFHLQNCLIRNRKETTT